MDWHPSGQDGPAADIALSGIETLQGDVHRAGSQDGQVASRPRDMEQEGAVD